MDFNTENAVVAAIAAGVGGGVVAWVKLKAQKPLIFAKARKIDAETEEVRVRVELTAADSIIETMQSQMLRMSERILALETSEKAHKEEIRRLTVRCNELEDENRRLKTNGQSTSA